MKCERAFQYVYSYLDGELRYTQRVMVHRHVRRCEGCGVSFDFERRVLALFKRAVSDTEIPPELFDRLRALVRREGDAGGIGPTA